MHSWKRCPTDPGIAAAAPEGSESRQTRRGGKKSPGRATLLARDMNWKAEPYQGHRKCVAAPLRRIGNPSASFTFQPFVSTDLALSKTTNILLRVVGAVPFHYPF